MHGAQQHESRHAGDRDGDVTARTRRIPGVMGRRALILLLLMLASGPLPAEDGALYPVSGRFGLAAHKHGPSLEAAQSVLNDPGKECGDGGRWFDFRGGIRVDHFTGAPLTFRLQQARFTPPDTYYLVEGGGIGDSFILHKASDTAIDIVMTDGANLFIQLWMVKCG